MTRRSMILLLIFVVIAGAIAGAFVFLGRVGGVSPSAMPGVYGSTSGAAQHEWAQYTAASPAYAAETGFRGCV